MTYSLCDIAVEEGEHSVQNHLEKEDDHFILVSLAIAVLVYDKTNQDDFIVSVLGVNADLGNVP